MKKSSLPPLHEGPGEYIYFSFCEADAEAALRIVSAFYRNGFRVWYDPRRTGLSRFSRFSSSVCIDRLMHAGSIVCILSSGYAQDMICTREMSAAMSNGKNVIPVSLDAYLPDSLSLSLSGGQVYQLGRSSRESAADNLVYSVFEENGFPLCSCRRDHEETEPGSGSDSFGGWREDTGSFKPVRPEPAPSAPSTQTEAAKPSAPPKPPQGFLSRIISGLTKKRGYTAKTEEKPADSVSFSVLSPRAVKPDSYGVIDLHMYTEAQRETVDRAIRESGGLVRETSKSGFTVRRETAVTVRLESDGAEIRDPLETQTWNGHGLRFDFRFYVPADYARSQIAFTCYIEYNGIPVTRLNFITEVSRLPDPSALPAKVTRSDYRKAFISYSRKDEQRMLARVLGIHELAPEMKFWLDKQSLDAGDLWREEIRRAIDISDVLLLFWSVAASKSAEVENEWRYGLEQNGLSFIAPVPLDPPEQCPPPEALSALNFTVRAFSRNNATEQLSFYNSRNIQII